jgi:MFS family permease
LLEAVRRREQEILDQTQERQPSQPRAVAIVCILFFLVYLGNSLWLSLFPNYLLRLGMNSLLIGITLMVYNASLSLTFLPSGRLSDKLGRRPLIIVGSLLLALSTLYLGLTRQTETTVLAVIGQGVGLGLLVPSGNALISDVASGRGAGFVFAIYQIATLSAAVVGSFGAGALATDLGFPTMFLLSAALTGSTAVIGYLMVPETITGKVSGYASVVTESLRSSITGTVRMLQSNRELALLTGALVIHAIGFSMINPFVPLFAEEGIHLDISKVGIIISVWNAGLAVAQIPSGRMTDRVGARPMLLTHFALSSLSWVIYAWSWNFESGITTALFFGIVGALDMPARRTIMIEYATAEAGKATIIGSLDAITGLTGIFGPLIGGFMWEQMGYAAPFQAAGLINAFACAPLIVIMRRRAALRSEPTASHAAPE